MSVAILLCLLVGCGGKEEQAANVEEVPLSVLSSANASYDAARQAEQAAYAAQVASYDRQVDPSSVDAYDVEDTGDYVCTDDCSGHEAGFAWAQEHDITDESDCGGKSMSFIEGCEAFARERQEQAEQMAEEDAESADEDDGDSYDY
ncbi:hypothetical protein [Thermomonas fusca]